VLLLLDQLLALGIGDFVVKEDVSDEEPKGRSKSKHETDVCICSIFWCTSHLMLIK
jgi:hypothetical protein